MPGLFSSRRSELISNEGRQMEAEAPSLKSYLGGHRGSGHPFEVSCWRLGHIWAYINLDVLMCISVSRASLAAQR